MDKICDDNSCTGCMACYSACLADAINFIPDKKGFLYPVINKEKCIDCKKCINVCPINKENDNAPDLQKIYACWQIDSEIRKQSTSGGVFSIISDYVLDNKGIVFGARFDNDFKVIHSYTDNKAELFNYRGSKYVQSYIGDSFKQVEQFLKIGKTVFFTGTPCQISGLKSFLSREYDNLITADIVCHGVPSPMVFADYVEYIKNTINKDIVNIYFRYKKPSWTVFSMRIDFKDHQSYIKDTNTDPYIVGFLNDLFTRPCCSVCKYTNLNRCSDITMADFWGYISEEKKFRNTEEGISLVIINSNKGKAIFEHIKHNLIIAEKSIEEAKAGNQCLSKPFPKSLYEKQFWKEYLNDHNFESVTKKYFPPKKLMFSRKISLYFNDHAYIFTKSQMKFVLKVKTKIKRILKTYKIIKTNG